MLKLFPCQPNIVLGFITTNPKFDPFSQHCSFPISHRSFRYCTTTTAATTTTTTTIESISKSESDTTPFAVSYLVNNFGFSHESALRAFNNKRVRFKSPENPNSVINFFKNNGFSNSDIRIIIRKQPSLLSSKPHKTLLPKIEFFLSKGVSSYDIVLLLTANPIILKVSLEKRIIPLFELLSRFLKTNRDVNVWFIQHSTLFLRKSYPCMLVNINLLTDFGICNSSIATLLQIRPHIFGSNDLIKSLEEVEGLGFNPSTTTFVTALMAKKGMSKKLWNQKVDVFKKWGWSDEDVIQAFRSNPSLMLASIDKVNLFMTFWVNQLGWDSLALVKCPLIFGYSLHTRIIPRASVLLYLLMKGLRENDASLVKPFTYTEKMFLSKFVFRFKRESHYLLKLYQGKVKLAYTKEHNGMPHATH